MPIDHFSRNTPRSSDAYSSDSLTPYSEDSSYVASPTACTAIDYLSSTSSCLVPSKSSMSTATPISIADVHSTVYTSHDSTNWAYPAGSTEARTAATAKSNSDSEPTQSGSDIGIAPTAASATDHPDATTAADTMLNGTQSGPQSIGSNEGTRLGGSAMAGLVALLAVAVVLL